MKQISTKKIKSVFTKKRLVALAILTVIAGLLWFYLHNYTSLSSKNYAWDIASPVEKELIASGAVKECIDGDNGKSFSNRAPWYSASYETHLTADEARELIQSVGKKTGYTFELGSEAESLYYVDKSKASSFTDLEPGNVQVSISIYGSSSDFGCFNDNIGYDDENVALRLNTSLPHYRQ